MPEHWMAQAVFGAAIGLVTALISVRIALHRFYREKWWEKRLEAYSKLIEVLSEMDIVLTVAKAKERNPQIADAFGSHSVDEMPALMIRFRQVHAFCGLLMSKAMNQLAQDLSKALPASALDFEAARRTVSEAIIRANEIARKDLRLPSLT